VAKVPAEDVLGKDAISGECAGILFATGHSVRMSLASFCASFSASFSNSFSRLSFSTDIVILRALLVGRKVSLAGLSKRFGCRS
jgi:hypothetical protein